MITAIQPVSVTVLPPVPSWRRAVPAVSALPPVAPFADPAELARPIAPVDRDASAARRGKVVDDTAPSGPRAGQDFALELEALLSLHTFAESRGLTLNRHPEATGAYGRAQTLTGSDQSRVDLRV